MLKREKWPNYENVMIVSNKNTFDLKIWYNLYMSHFWNYNICVEGLSRIMCRKNIGEVKRGRKGCEKNNLVDFHSFLFGKQHYSHMSICTQFCIHLSLILYSFVLNLISTCPPRYIYIWHMPLHKTKKYFFHYNIKAKRQVEESTELFVLSPCFHCISKPVTSNLPCNPSHSMQQACHQILFKVS